MEADPFKQPYWNLDQYLKVDEIVALMLDFLGKHLGSSN